MSVALECVSVLVIPVWNKDSNTLAYYPVDPTNKAAFDLELFGQKSIQDLNDERKLAFLSTCPIACSENEPLQSFLHEFTGFWKGIYEYYTPLKEAEVAISQAIRHHREIFLPQIQDGQLWDEPTETAKPDIFAGRYSWVQARARVINDILDCYPILESYTEHDLETPCGCLTHAKLCSERLEGMYKSIRPPTGADILPIFDKALNKEWPMDDTYPQIQLTTVLDT